MFWPIVFIASTGLAAAGFVVVAILWLAKLRTALGSTLAETATHHMRSVQRLSESMAILERQNQQHEQQMNEMAELVLRMRQELTSLEGHLEPDQPDSDIPRPAPHHKTIH